MASKFCAHCGTEIEEGMRYFMVGDNYLQVKYFDSAEDNVFCCTDCVLQSLTVLEVENKGEDDGR